MKFMIKVLAKKLTLGSKKMTNVIRKRVSIDLSKPKMTDQSGLKASNINNIMEQYKRTGVLPEVRQKIARYVDNTEIPSLEEAHDIIVEAREMFMALPAQVRKLMDNDPTRLVEFIKDPENVDVLIKYGVIEKSKEPLSPKQELEGGGSTQSNPTPPSQP